MYKSGLDLVLRVCVVGVELRGFGLHGWRRERGNAWHGMAWHKAELGSKRWIHTQLHYALHPAAFAHDRTNTKS
jgi:hypothetical protein